MKIVQEVSLISVGSFAESNDWLIIRSEIRDAISLIVHPPGTSNFTINPTKHGNGVKPIKEACMIPFISNHTHLKNFTNHFFYRRFSYF
ncbi:hypothetical protein NIES2100_30180 [Calothrix sp. NIES-2100]|uniref:hypothetical protein n=1 Tax=Calothrix sp. NIES-2100 TaxID=1954172 RepID=UPI000B5DDE65|nr:hypothetical protein NIES2100_30180 [Calothrix sp. NIES-2100]